MVEYLTMFHSPYFFTNIKNNFLFTKVFLELFLFRQNLDPFSSFRKECRTTLPTQLQADKCQENGRLAERNESENPITIGKNYYRFGKYPAPQNHAAARQPPLSIRTTGPPARTTFQHLAQIQSFITHLCGNFPIWKQYLKEMECFFDRFRWE